MARRLLDAWPPPPALGTGATGAGGPVVPGRARALALAALLACALLVRLAVLWAVSGYQSPWPWEVEIMSQSLVRDGTLAFTWFGRTEPRPRAFLPPVYPLVVAAAMWLGGEHYALLLQLGQAVLSTASVGLLVPVA